MKLKLNLKNKNQALSVIGLVGLGLVVGLAGLVLAVLPQGSRVSSLDKQIEAAQSQFASLHSISDRGPSLRAAQLFQLARAMPDVPDMPGVVNDLSRAAAASSVAILQFSPQPAIVQTDGANAIPLRITVTGSWHGISAFLHVLRTNVRVGKRAMIVSGRVFVVDSVSLTAAGSATAGSTAPTGELAASLVVDAFTYAAPVPITPTDTTSTSTTSTTTTPAPAGSAVAAGPTGSVG